MRAHEDDAGAVARYRAVVERQVHQLTRIVDDLLDVSRITRGKIVLRPERTTIRRGAHRARSSRARPLFEQRRITRSPSPCRTSRSRLDGDPVRLAQVLANLSTNAAKYTDPGGHVDVRVAREGGDAVVSVRDDGIGIPAECSRASSISSSSPTAAREKAQGGLGIGLTLVKRLVEMHGGSVEVKSAGPGLGTEAIVRLPEAAKPAAEAGLVRDPRAVTREEDGAPARFGWTRRPPRTMVRAPMRVLVFIKQVPDVAEIRFDPATRTLVREGVPLVVNPFDRPAIALAVDLKQRRGARTTAATMGPPQAREALYEALASGVERAVHLEGRAFAGADTLATARALAALARREGFDLLICGKHTIDGETAQVGPEVAELLGIPHVSGAAKIAWSEDGKRLVVERETDDGHEEIDLPLPCLLSVAEHLLPPIGVRKPALEAARLAPVETLGPADLGLADGRGRRGGVSDLGRFRSASRRPSRARPWRCSRARRRRWPPRSPTASPARWPSAGGRRPRPCRRRATERRGALPLGRRRDTPGRHAQRGHRGAARPRGRRALGPARGRGDAGARRPGERGAGPGGRRGGRGQRAGARSPGARRVHERGLERRRSPRP